MRTSLLALGAALSISLTACGSSTDTSSSPTPTVAVESQSASGAVASAEECPANSPVRGILAVSKVYDDGVFGHVYNNTGSPVWVWSQRKDAASPCLLSPGKGASFGSASPPGSDDAPWVPSRTRIEFQDQFTDQFWILVTSSPDSNAPGTAVGVVDPNVGYPDAVSIYTTAGGSRCDGDKRQLRTAGLKENREYRLKGNSQGSVLVKRLDDNEVIAREWMQTSDADDWARLDLYVESIGRC